MSDHHRGHLAEPGDIWLCPRRPCCHTFYWGDHEPFCDRGVVERPKYRLRVPKARFIEPQRYVITVEVEHHQPIPQVLSKLMFRELPKDAHVRWSLATESIVGAPE